MDSYADKKCEYPAIYLLSVLAVIFGNKITMVRERHYDLLKTNKWVGDPARTA